MSALRFRTGPETARKRPSGIYSALSHGQGMVPVMESIGFPDGPRSDLEDRVADLVDRAQDVLRTHGRLRHLLEESRLRERWATATAEVTAALLGDDPLEDVLTTIADRVLAFIDADLVTVVVPEADQVRVAAAVGVLAEDLRASRFPMAATLAGAAMASGTVVTDQQWPHFRSLEGAPSVGPSVAIPLRVRAVSLGALTIARRPGAREFDVAEVALADEFGRQTSVALAISQGRQDRRRLERIDDRRRIARDLHDHVIQRLFAAGLSLQVMAQHAPDELRARIEEQVSTLDSAIVEIRTAVFALSSVDGATRATTRDRLLDVVAELSPALSRRPRVTFSGPVDRAITGELARDVIAVVRESVANVARHAPDAACVVEVIVRDDMIAVRVTDDGPGPGGARRRGGTANLAARAARNGGRYSLHVGEMGGTVVTWEAPRRREPTGPEL